MVTSARSIYLSTIGRCEQLWADLTWREVSGSLGDLGTLIPLLVALSHQGCVDFGSALFWAGIFNIVGGLQWDTPMPVQPMKSVASIALTEELSAAEVACAGLGVAVVVALLGLTGAIEIVNRVVPWPVVRGMQLGLGLSMCIKGVAMIEKTNQWLGLDSYLTAILMAGATLIGLQAEKHIQLPVALILFLAGAAVALGKLIEADKSYQWEVKVPVSLAITDFTASTFLSGFVKASLPQIPLTTLNSVVSVCKLSEDLFPAKEVTRESVAISVGLMNIVGCCFGGMPVCHGAGGLAGQYRFGARTGSSVVFLGLLKIVLVLSLGGGFVALLESYPGSVLG